VHIPSDTHTDEQKVLLPGIMQLMTKRGRGVSGPPGRCPCSWAATSAFLRAYSSGKLFSMMF